MTYKRPSHGKHEIRLESAGFTRYPSTHIATRQRIMISIEDNRGWLRQIQTHWAYWMQLSAQQFGWK